MTDDELLNDAENSLQNFARRTEMLETVTKSVDRTRIEPLRQETGSQFEAQIRRFEKKDPLPLPNFLLNTPAPSECCMYPWPNPESPIYLPEDLPSTVIEGGVTVYNHIAGTYRYESTFDDMIIEPGTGENSGIWIQYPASSPELIAHGTGCLIAAVFGGIEDQFSTTYTVTYLGVEPSEEYTVTRVSTCRWETADGLTWLEYVYNAETLDTKWNLHIQGASSEMSKVGDSTPVGDYDNGSEMATVS